MGSPEEFTEAVAVVGLTCRFPGAATPDQFWANLRAGVESVRTFTDTELLEAGLDPEIIQQPAYVKAQAQLGDVAGFDAALFGFNPREADILDPQQRLFLECAWEGLEHAGYAPNGGLGSVAVYAGVGPTTYLLDLHGSPAIRQLIGDYELGLANDKDHFTTRVAYKLNLQGPSVTVQTACSSALVSVVMACQALLIYQCDMALAGGAALYLPQTGGYPFRKGGIMSPDGHCRAFDAAAAGTVPGSGAGVVVLKRLSEARQDGDTIYAVIRGSAINNDGAEKVGFTAPSVDGQAKVIAAAHTLAGISADAVSYVEAHGTGTALGDPIEVAALTQAFRISTQRRGFCAIGSVKTNIGHLDHAAGIAGLIKTVLALYHGELPPTLHFKQPNPKIDLENSPFYVNTTLTPWTTDGRPRLAGVSSFGVGGTNAHVVLEEAPQQPTALGKLPSTELLVLSAATPTAVEQMSTNLAQHLRTYPELCIGDVAHTLQQGRAALANRRVVVARDLEDAARTLDSGQAPLAHVPSREAPVAFLFPGQGAQHVDMARELYEHEPVFRETLDRCCALLEPHLGRDLRRTIFAAGLLAEDGVRELRQTALAQPALVAVEYALARWWASLGIEPQAMLGHSIGEYTAACLAGVFELGDALALVAARGRLMQALATGAMLAVPLAEEDVRPYVRGDLALAAVNGPQLCVVAGPIPSVDELEARLIERGIATSRLHTSHAFHSPMMDPIVDSFRAEVARVRLSPPRVRYLSNVTGTWITAEQATNPAYWADHLRGTVRFADGLNELFAEPGQLVLEVGPGQNLSRLAKRHPTRQADQAVVASLPHPSDAAHDREVALGAVGQLWLAGRRIRWSGLRHAPARRIALPTYPFQRERHWIEPAAPATTSRESAALLARRAEPAEWLYAPSWQRTVEGGGQGAAVLARRALNWLVFCDALGLGEQLATRLEAIGQRVTRVSRGCGFKALGERRYALNPTERQPYSQLFDDLRANNSAPDRVVHLWSLTGDRVRNPAAVPDHEALDLGFYSLLFLAQVLGAQPGAPIDVTAVSDHMHLVTGDELLQPEKAAMLGPGTVVPLEHPHLFWRSIDLGQAWASNAATPVIECLLDELALRPGDTPRVVALRGEHRWTQTFEPLRVADNTASRVREGGVYLITGGMGGVGLALAQFLADSARVKLALVGRSDFPPRESWPIWLAEHDAADSISSRIRQIQHIEANGSEVIVERGDIADPTTAKALVSRVVERFGGLHGVIHAAGIPGEGVVQLKTVEAAHRVLAPKIAGTLALAAAIGDAPLDFVVLCSSLSVVLGGAGQVDYAAANAFLDAFANGRAARGDRAVVSINWDAWANEGMWARAASASNPHTLLARESSIAAMTPDEGAQAFARALALGLPQVLVSTQDLLARTRHWAVNQANDVSPRQASSAVGLHARPELSTAMIAPRDEVEQQIACIWQDLLGIQELGIDDNFFELGGHSLLGLQLTSALRTTFHLECSLARLFEAPTVAQLAAFVRSETKQLERAEPDLAEMLKLVDQLSEDDIRALITESDALAERT